MPETPSVAVKADIASRLPPAAASKPMIRRARAETGTTMSVGIDPRPAARLQTLDVRAVVKPKAAARRS